MRKQKLIKLVHCLRHLGLWKYLAHGVAPSIEHRSALRDLPVKQVVDVGANRGQFALFCLQTWPDVNVVCLEPLPVPAATIRKLFPEGRIELVQTAASDAVGVSSMYVTKGDDSSSVLKLEASQAASSDELTLDHVEEGIRLDTLDRILADKAISTEMLLKIDVQGLEDRVLLGATGVLPKIRWIYVECSFRELYVGQKLSSWVVAHLDRAGFELAGVYNQDVRPGIGAVQADFLFENRTFSDFTCGR